MVDLFLDGVATRQRSAALFDQLRSAIASGRLAAGDRLPTTRELAAELGVARSTIATVYARLVGEGYAEGRTGDGTFVADYHSSAASRARSATALDVVRIARPAPMAGPGLVAPAGGWRVDLRTGRPDPALFPVAEWRRCVTAVLDRPPPGYGDLAGLPELRHAIAGWIARSRGLRATADNVLITAGAQGGFDLCARTLLGRGDVVVVEDPGYEPGRRVFTHHGAKVAAVPVDAGGLRVDLIPRHARGIVVTPSHQAPTGSVLSSARRRRLLDIAQANDAVILEDDYDTEFRYVDRPLEPLHLLDTRGRVVYIGTFSKTLSPSLRIGFLVAPPAVVDELTRTRHLVDTQPPHLTQAALAALLTTGGFERHLRRCRRVYRARRDHLVGLLDRLLDDGLIANFARCHAGLHTTIRLQATADAEIVADQLRARGIAIATTAENRISHGGVELVVGFGLADEDQLRVAMRALRRTLAALKGASPSDDDDAADDDQTAE